MQRYLIVACAAMFSLLIAGLAGCGGSGVVDPTNVQPAVADNVVNVGDPNDPTTGSISISIGDILAVNPGEASAKSVTSRWPFWTTYWPVINVTAKNDVTQAVIGSQDVNGANPSGSFMGIPGGTKIKVYVTAYANLAKTVIVTTGTSPQTTILSGQTVSITITLAATKPVLTVMAPADGATVTSSPVTVQVKAVDIGGGAPAVVLTDNGTAVTTVPTITGDSSATGRVFTWQLTQADGAHALVATFTGTSHIDAGNSGVRTLAWDYSVDPVLPEYKGWQGNRTLYATVLTSGPLSGYTAELLVVMAPDATVADMYWAIYLDADNYYDLVSSFDTETGQTIGFTEVRVGGIEQNNPAGTADISVAGSSATVSLGFSADGLMITGVNYTAPMTDQIPY